MVFQNGAANTLLHPISDEVRSTRTSRRAHNFVVDCAVNRTMHYRENSFFARTARLWNDIPAEVFPVGYDIDKFKSNVYKKRL